MAWGLCRCRLPGDSRGVAVGCLGAVRMCVGCDGMNRMNG